MDELKILKEALEEGIIDEAAISSLKGQIEMKKNNDILEKHYSIYSKWIGESNGYWYSYVEDSSKKRGKRLIKKKKEADLDNYILNYYSDQKTNPTFKDVFYEWINRRLQLNKITKATYDRYIQIYNKHFAIFGEYRIKTITEEDVVCFLESQIPEHKLSSKGFSNLKIITKSTLKYAKRKGYTSISVYDIFYERLDVSDVDYREVYKEDHEEVFDERETAKMLGYLKANRDHINLAILLMFVTGLRIGELVTLRGYDLGEQSIMVRRTATRYKADDGYKYAIKNSPKTRAGIRNVIVPDEYRWLVDVLSHRYQQDCYIFTGSKTKFLSPQTIRTRLKNIEEKLGISHKSPHKIRKTYGSILLDNGLDRVFIQSQMGHTTISTTEKSYHRNRRDEDLKRKMVSSISEFF